MSEHVTVLLHEAIDGLSLTPDSVVIDATIGGTGHLKEIVSRLGKKGVLLGIDADSRATERAKAVQDSTEATVVAIEGNFRDIVSLSASQGIATADAVLFDLGWSGYHLKSGKGFSFLADEPLLMTYGNPEDYSLTARDLVNEGSVESLKTIISSYGEDRRAGKIARAIVDAREEKPIETGKELGDIILKALGRQGKTHPATKTFQAIRIAVNDELEALREGLLGAKSILKDGGRIAVISFHSIEDRMVKRLFLSFEGRVVTKKPVIPSEKEQKENPRARSAKLRIYEHQRT
jgi:16S rRNA (cytosine1402-N4)-methyltransferase